MEHWEDHGFAPTGPLEKGNTHVDVYPNDDNAKWRRRAQELKPPHYPRINDEAQNWEEKHEKKRQEMRRSPMYQFVMLVASFANLRLNQMWRTPAEDPSKASGSADESAGQLGSLGNDPISDQYDFQHRWTSSPLISGHLYLSPKVFGHLMEAEELVKNCTGTSMEAHQLMENSRTRVLFARLVAIRINMSAFLSGLNYQLDRNYRRLMTQQTMVLRALKSKVGRAGSRAQRLPAVPGTYARVGARQFNVMTGTF